MRNIEANKKELDTKYRLDSISQIDELLDLINLNLANFREGELIENFAAMPDTTTIDDYQIISNDIKNIKKILGQSWKEIANDVNKLIQFLTKQNDKPEILEKLKELDQTIKHNDRQLEFLEELQKLQVYQELELNELHERAKRRIITEEINEAIRYAKHKFNDSIKLNIYSLEHMAKAFSPGSTSYFATMAMVDSLKSSLSS
ncbi:MAG: hypothetical protein O3C63_08050 [Cyanobacteria bacterium]|nr:hypothetical protein [Cyanobacteriota bacterium]MDA1021244.1 hypothetical protein [Cyanobacteriota bacterium]